MCGYYHHNQNGRKKVGEKKTISLKEWVTFAHFFDGGGGDKTIKIYVDFVTFAHFLRWDVTWYMSHVTSHTCAFHWPTKVT